MNIFRYRLPSPFREGLLVEIDGNWGEVAPLPERNQESLQDALQQLQALSKGQKVEKLFPSVAFGIASAKTPHQPSRISSAALLMGDAKNILQGAKKAKELGFSTAKLKIKDLALDVAISLTQELKKAFRLRIDANKTWSLAQALHFCSFFSKDDFDYIEDPLQNDRELSSFPLPFAIDDGVFVTKNMKASAIILKPTVLGNAWHSLASLAKKQGIEPILSSSFESGIGLARVAALSRQLGTTLPMGLGTHLYLQEDLLQYPLHYERGELVLPPFYNPKIAMSYLAFESDEEALSYDRWNTLIEEKAEKMASLAHQIAPLIATLSLSTILSYFALLRAKATPLLISPYLPQEEAQKLLLAYRSQEGWPGHTLLFTSGTSGHPKIACLSEESLWMSAGQVNQAVNLTSGDLWRLHLPLFHVGGIAILYRCLLARATISLKKITPTHISLVPTHLYRLLQKGETIASKCALIGGAPVPPSLIQQAKDKGIPVVEAYGMTEMCSTIAIDGDVLQNCKIALLETQEICVGGTTLFKGYFTKGAPLYLPLNTNGLFATGDLGKWESEQLKILGRKDRLFFSGGENIHPEEIENALLEIPGVMQAAVLPLSDPEYGARPIAFVETSLSAAVLQAALRERLSGIKIPTAFYQITGVTWKLRLADLRLRLEEKRLLFPVE